ncbi:MAG TPA: DUF2189 domain-containing protein [Rhodocyclaceae bacterium]|nr:DUF2189 domain-containing protein [Rhodocyclaceae bacterium]
MTMNETRLTFASIRRALAQGLTTAQRTRGVSVGYAGVFAIIGAVIAGGLIKAGMTPFFVAAAGAFMLVGPITLAGFFGVARAVEAGRKAGADDVFNGFHHPPGALWAVALVCTLLFMIFVTDAGILYSYLIGGTRLFPADMLPLPANVAGFLFWSAASGAVIAFLLFTVSAFSIPLLCERRTHLVAAIVTSVRIVFGNFAVTMAWAIFISAAIMASIVILPLFPFVLPVLAYASHALYREALPPGS